MSDRNSPRAAPTRLTFSLPEARGTVASPANSQVENEAGIVAADLLRNSLGLTEEGSALHSFIKSALGLHDAWLKQNQNNIIARGSASADARVTDALLRRLNSAYLSGGGDEEDDTPKEMTKEGLIRRRKTRRLIERKKIGSMGEGLCYRPFRISSSKPNALQPP